MSEKAKIMLVIVAGLIILAGGILINRMQNRTDQRVDCAPGFHNVAGPSSQCVPD